MKKIIYIFVLFIIASSCSTSKKITQEQTKVESLIDSTKNNISIKETVKEKDKKNINKSIIKKKKIYEAPKDSLNDKKLIYEEIIEEYHNEVIESEKINESNKEEQQELISNKTEMSIDKTSFVEEKKEKSIIYDIFTIIKYIPIFFFLFLIYKLFK